jgi:mannosyl-3-phosphoglycerate phosphatase
MHWLIFTDLDSTLLSHEDYSFVQAQPALERLATLQIPLIINSSKTSAEIESIRQQMHNNCAYSVENGAAVFVPDEKSATADGCSSPVILGTPLAEILSIAHSLREQYHFAFRGFFDFTVEVLMQQTGLSAEQAAQAKQRCATEPIQWLDSSERLIQFTELLQQQGLSLVKGGRFHHIMGNNDKAGAMAWLLNKYQKQFQETIGTIALGDSQNDRKMLELADYAGIIRKLDGSHLEINKNPERIVISDSPAPLGWQEVMDRLFVQLNLGECNE